MTRQTWHRIDLREAGGHRSVPKPGSRRNTGTGADLPPGNWTMGELGIHPVPGWFSREEVTLSAWGVADAVRGPVGSSSV